MNISKIAHIASAISIMLNLNVSQKIELDNYVKMKQYQWCEEQKHEEEIESLIKQEASKIASK